LWLALRFQPDETVPVNLTKAKLLPGLLLAGLLGVVFIGLHGESAEPRPASSTANAPTSPSASARGAVTRPATAPANSALAPLDATVWKVPVYPDDPVKGPKDALVTVVGFSEFESPLCKRAAATLDELLTAYPKDVRFVWKDNPLPFDAHAKSAATLARSAFEQKGQSGFWTAHDRLFASQPALGSAELHTIAQTLSLVWEPTKALADGSRQLAKLEQSIVLGGDVEARGTPHFFLNGVRLAGSQPLDTFRALVEQELPKARARVDAGLPRERVYEEIMKGAKEPPPLIRQDIPQPAPDSPFRGDAGARVAIQQFAEFPCAPCAHLAQTLAYLESDYGHRLKVAWRFLPSASDPKSLIAQAAEEVFVQGGAPAFWLFHERVLDARDHGTALDQKTLERIATETSVNAEKLRRALESKKHLRRVNDDAALAQKLGVSQGPALAINGYFFASERPGPVLRKAIVRALADP
jgi:protein-disulfide isomerase